MKKIQKVKVQMTEEGKKVYIWSNKLKMYVLVDKEF